MTTRRTIWLATLAFMGSPALAQEKAPEPGVDLPRVTVTADAFTESRGGYVISGDFRVDPRMPNVVFPASALAKDDVLSVQPQHLNSNEYLVLQECASADCSDARIVRVWTAGDNHSISGGNNQRIIIPHENKYWIWVKRLPEISRPDCETCSAYFTSFERFGPPMTIQPNGGKRATTGRNSKRRPRPIRCP